MTSSFLLLLSAVTLQRTCYSSEVVNSLNNQTQRNPLLPPETVLSPKNGSNIPKISPLIARYYHLTSTQPSNHTSSDDKKVPSSAFSSPNECAICMEHSRTNISVNITQLFVNESQLCFPYCHQHKMCTICVDKLNVCPFCRRSSRQIEPNIQNTVTQQIPQQRQTRPRHLRMFQRQSTEYNSPQPIFWSNRDGIPIYRDIQLPMHDIGCRHNIRFKCIRPCVKCWIELTSGSDNYFSEINSASRDCGHMCPLITNWIDCNSNFWRRGYCFEGVRIGSCVFTTLIPIIISGGCFGIECGMCYCCGCFHPTSNLCMH